MNTKYVYITNPTASLQTPLRGLTWKHRQGLTPYTTAFRFLASDVMSWSDYNDLPESVPADLRLCDIPSIACIIRRDTGRQIKWVETPAVGQELTLRRLATNILPRYNILINASVPYWKRKPHKKTKITKEN